MTETNDFQEHLAGLVRGSPSGRLVHGGTERGVRPRRDPRRGRAGRARPAGRRRPRDEEGGTVGAHPGVPRGHAGPADARSPTRPSVGSGARSAGAQRCGDQRVLFTTVATPAMTRLRMPERAGPRHARRRRRRQVTEPRARVVRPPRGREAGGVARGPPTGAGERRGRPSRGPRRPRRAPRDARSPRRRSSRGERARVRRSRRSAGTLSAPSCTCWNVRSANANAIFTCGDPWTS